MTDSEKVYGDAIYDVALEFGETKAILEEMKTLRSSFREEPAFLTLLASPAVSKEERCKLLDDCFAGKISIHLLNFLKIITENSVIRSFDKHCEEFINRYNDDNNIVAVRAVSATVVPDELKSRLSDKIRSITGKEPEITYELDPEAIGGILVDVEGTRFDGTIRKRLDNMRKALKESL